MAAVALVRSDGAAPPKAVQPALESGDFPLDGTAMSGGVIGGLLQAGRDAVGLHPQRAGQIDRGGVALAGLGDEHRADHAEQRQQHDTAHDQAAAKNDGVVVFHRRSPGRGLDERKVYRNP